MARKHQLDEVLRTLGKKHDIRIDTNVKVVEVLTGKDFKVQCKHDVGNGSWGKIDFLCNYNGYTQMFVDRFSRGEDKR